MITHEYIRLGQHILRAIDRQLNYARISSEAQDVCAGSYSTNTIKARHKEGVIHPLLLNIITGSCHYLRLLIGLPRSPCSRAKSLTTCAAGVHKPSSTVNVALRTSIGAQGSRQETHRARMYYWGTRLTHIRIAQPI